MISCMRVVEFDAGHRVSGHESKCARVHGHRYKVELHARRAASLHGGRGTDDIGRVVDFSVLKERIGRWLDEHWDHRTLLFEGDPALAAIRLLDRVDDIGADEQQGMLALHTSLVVVPFNPTAENMAQYIGEVVSPVALAHTGVEVFRVTVWETPNCEATWQK